eukprot:Rhum_TRINITY_DN7680_c0_g1::Rhum_TRINITY_DN7680_c0_g1_i1::g.24172::m.24172
MAPPTAATATLSSSSSSSPSADGQPLPPLPATAHGSDGGGIGVCRITSLPPDVLRLVCRFLCVVGRPGERHALASWQRCSLRLYEGVEESDWRSVWDATYAATTADAARRFAAAVPSPAAPAAAGARARGSQRAFLAALRGASVQYHLELGLLPPAPPPWCGSKLDVERALYKTLRFCTFRVATARQEMECTRGSIPVVESGAVLSSLLHIVAGGTRYLAHPVPRPTALLTAPMYGICATWALNLGAYGAYRIMRAAVRSIPAEAAQLWQLPGGSSSHGPGGSGRLQAHRLWQLLTDDRFLGAFAWTGCLTLSLCMWHAEASRPEGGLSVRKILLIVFGPPTFAATLVAGHRSGRKVGLTAGAVVFATLSSVVLVPHLLFLALLTWSTTLSLRLHRRGYYKPPRWNTVRSKVPSSVAKALGDATVLSIAGMSLGWFVTPYECFLHLLVLAVAVLSAWIAVAVFAPLVARCWSMGVPLPANYFFLQAATSLLLLTSTYAEHAAA